mmetsp:Transcript_22989/g.46420  ORF Transcript_22989/g.46420 Transcript_22989/m.46420 type:complete len:182 (-) Transcript_22989:154-699(-)|eukprot:CAMPEP_0181331080 /NCGR_PEP_ID=MMETSP1101-20121128/24288_1 /TAXON_ID=46948 /ORGANISM="Rhodomonas abbreviata, Strain Caron Lab Isolate" /LENGTH=181 /DNA_ID=CAMNT_0023440471 /DNA_START=77 /DNA_END=622 /DNA_ORIENTATION=-
MPADNDISGEREGLLQKPKRHKKQYSTMQRYSIMLCGTEGPDWGHISFCLIFGGVVVVVMLVTATGQFSQWNMMGSVSKAWSADGDNDVITNGYSSHPGAGNAGVTSAWGSAKRNSSAIEGAADRLHDKKKRAPSDETFASSSADHIRDWLGLGPNGAPSWARHSNKQVSRQATLAQQAKA